jgi:very-short-patch-repair endonuclease
MKNYNQLNEIERIHIIQSEYVLNNKSFSDIANEYNTYTNKIRRDAIKFNIKIRDKSEAQKNALKTGKHKHPTKGKKRDEKTKEKIGMSVMDSWTNMDEKELERRSVIAKANWDKLTEEEKQQRLQKANVAVRETSKLGSKLERFLLENLVQQGIKVEPHKEQILSNTKLHIDLFLYESNIAIEVDGPSHFRPVWGEEALKRNQDYDNKKTGLLIGKGINLIRVKQTKDFSKARAKIILEKLLIAIEQINNGKDNFVEIGDE